VGARGDINARFDEINHRALLGRVRAPDGDKGVMALVKRSLAAGVLSEDGVTTDTKMGTPQGGILSPLLANIVLSVLDERSVAGSHERVASHTPMPEVPKPMAWTTLSKCPQRRKTAL
jgi:retron-type reverse transcriptase